MNTETTTTCAPFNAMALSDGYVAGQDAAQATIAGVYVFEGAIPAATSRGYVAGTLAHDAFVTGYLHTLQAAFPNGTPVTPEGFIARA